MYPAVQTKLTSALDGAAAATVVTLPSADAAETSRQVWRRPLVRRRCPRRLRRRQRPAASESMVHLQNCRSESGKYKVAENQE